MGAPFLGFPLKHLLVPQLVSRWVLLGFSRRCSVALSQQLVGAVHRGCPTQKVWVSLFLGICLGPWPILFHFFFFQRNLAAQEPPMKGTFEGVEKFKANLGGGTAPKLAHLCCPLVAIFSMAGGQ